MEPEPQRDALQQGIPAEITRADVGQLVGHDAGQLARYAGWHIRSGSTKSGRRSP